MSFFVRAVVTGFALTLGKALFEKVQGHLGLGPDADKDKKAGESDVVGGDTSTEPKLQR